MPISPTAVFEDSSNPCLDNKSTCYYLLHQRLREGERAQRSPHVHHSLSQCSNRFSSLACSSPPLKTPGNHWRREHLLDGINFTQNACQPQYCIYSPLPIVTIPTSVSGVDHLIFFGGGGGRIGLCKNFFFSLARRLCRNFFLKSSTPPPPSKFKWSTPKHIQKNKHQLKLRQVFLFEYAYNSTAIRTWFNY